MIDINTIENEFVKYVSNYNPSNERVKLKIEHIRRVAKNAKTIAKNLNLNEEDTNLAIAIGYFHDFGRFEQIKRANTFSDKESGINHGELSVKVLFENNLIRKFIETTEYDNIIKVAILNHNRPTIEENLNEKELLFSKIIRDADKLDIFYTISIPDYSMESIFWYNTWNQEEIDPEIINDFFTTNYIFYSKIKNNADVISIFYAYIFDLYFQISLKIVSEKKYLENFTKRVCNKFNSLNIHYQTNLLLEACNKYLV